MYFNIDKLAIRWGDTMAQIQEQTKTLDKFSPYSGWPNIRCKCSSVYGLSANECEIRGPHEHKPALQVSYELTAMQAPSPERTHEPYLDKLQDLFGTPHSSTSRYDEDWSTIMLQGTVVYNAKWFFSSFKITLSVYGDKREGDSGSAGAGLYVDWTDEVALAKPYMQEVQKMVLLFSESVEDKVSIEKFKLQTEQQPYYVPYYDLADPHEALRNENLRLAQIVLHKENLYPIPLSYRHLIDKNEIGYIQLEGQQGVIIANHWDFVYLNEEEAQGKIYYCDILPARGRGQRELAIMGLFLKDSRDSSALLTLAKKIENEVGIAIKCQIAHDD